MIDRGLIGKNLVYSFSKLIHEALTDYSYQLYSLPTEEEFHSFMEKKEFPGINVTIPYKEMVMSYCDEIDPKALAIGAVNTVVNRDGKLFGYNTDYDGFLYLANQTGISFQDKTVLILGTGGTFKTVSAVLRDNHAKEVYVASRTLKPELPNSITYEQALTLPSVDIIINTSPVGMYPDNQSCPIDLSHFPSLEGVLDVVYNPLHSTLVQNAHKCGIAAGGGLAMLVAQAKFAGEYFQGKPIEDVAMAKVFRQLRHRQSNLILIGMPSCGKSTIGHHCAHDMGREFIDLDTEIVKQAGCSIPELFETQGEDAFRALETKVCQQFAKEHGLVISTGGGIVTRPENMKALAQNGVLIYLTRSLGELSVGGNRPLSSSLDAIAQLEQERTPLYLAACHKKIENSQPIHLVAKQVQEAYYEVFSSERSES